jgi:tetratricopeptide (TPR) repeat protein
MERDFTRADADRHNALTRKGWSLIEGEILLNEPRPVGEPGWLARLKLQWAVRLFRSALSINPDGGSSMYAIGKIYQRRGRAEEALYWFGRAHDINPNQPDVSRESALAAMDLGRGSLAIGYCRAAITAGPGDPGLVANLALAYLIEGDIARARGAAEAAVSAAPDDRISSFVRSVIEEVASGRRPIPRTTLEISKYH